MNTEISKKHKTRDRFYFLAAIKNDKIIYKTIMSNTSSEAKNSFINEFNIEPTVFEDGQGQGYYEVKGPCISEIQKISVTVTPQQLASRTIKAYKGQFQGWIVWCSGLKSCEIDGITFNDNELVSVEFDSLIDENSKIPKPKLKKHEVIRLNNIKNISEL
jgi:hypothetical protein